MESSLSLLSSIVLVCSVQLVLGDEIVTPPDTAAYPIGDVRNCPSFSPQNDSQPLFLMDVLPGGGFDNLRNLDMGQVHLYNYSTCKVSNDGKYLLPDNIFLIPVKESSVDVFAEYFAHFGSFTSTTSNAINTAATGSFFFGSVSGQFSYEHVSVKSHQVSENASTVRVQIRNTLYEVKIQPDSQLHPTFKDRLFDIAANLQSNNTEYANYLAELLVREYGTHYLTTAEAGAVIYQIDHVTAAFVANTAGESTAVSAAAGVDFLGKVSFGAGFGHASSQVSVEAYGAARTHSQVFTAGGPPFRPNLTLEEWTAGIPDNLVAINRAGNPLHFAINPTTISELPEITLREVENTVYKAINRYYKVNTRRGCTNPKAWNFDYQANVDDGSCNWPPDGEFTFGGIYQTCQKDLNSSQDLCNSGPLPVAQRNPLTGDYTCPDGYIGVLLHSGSVTNPATRPYCKTTCRHCGFLGWGRCCKPQCIAMSILSSAKYEAYWCAPAQDVKIEPGKGYLFGGFYTPSFINPLTGSMSCPTYFVPLHFGENLEVCVSDNVTKAQSYSVPFGGFESCIAGNPLSASNGTNQNKWPHACPRGYSQHLVTVDEGCEINCCVKAGTYNMSSSLLPVELPPYRKRPQFKPNITNSLVIFGVYGDIWLKQSDGQWGRLNESSEDGYSFLQSIEGVPESTDDGADPNHRGSSSSLSSEEVAVISVLTTVVLCTIIAVVVFAVGCSIKWKRRNGYITINDGGSNAGENKI